MSSKTNIAVVFGGPSVEHEVSVVTGLQAAAALDRAKYTAIPVYLAKDGVFHTGEAFADIERYKDIPALLAEGEPVSFVREDETVRLRPLQKQKLFGGMKPLTVDAALLCLHGTGGEDGGVQGVFETLRLPYTGPNVLASALCMEKPMTKILLRTAGLPVLNDLVLEADAYNQDPAAVMSAIEGEIIYPVVIKPTNLGSSVGIAKANNREKLRAALETAFCYAERVLIEPAVVHLREFNCAVLGEGGDCRASVCEEPVMGSDILSYSDKYQSDSGKQSGISGQKRIIPAEISAEQTEFLQKTARAAFARLQCSGVARVDFLYDGRKEEFYINEINTIPGSLSFYLWEKTNLSFAALLDELLKIAFARRRRTDGLTQSYESNLLQTGAFSGKK